MKQRCLKIGFAVLLLVSYLGSQSAAQTKSSPAPDARRMDQVVRFFADDAHKSFMGAVLVARGSEVLFAKGYGIANLEWNIPNTPATRFYLASVSKQFTAAAILLLEERGKLKVGDPIKSYFPDAPAAWDGITFHHLLSHTSGLTTRSPGDRSTITLPSRPDKNVARFRNLPLEFQPGANFGYSNSGYQLLAHLIEKISGQRYEDFLRVNIFEPLGMKDSGLHTHAVVIPRRASGYERPRTPRNGQEVSDGPLENAPFIDFTNGMGAGGLYSTVEDLHRWTQGLFGGKLLSAASLAKMTTPVQNRFAYGLGVATVEGRQRFYHAGRMPGFDTGLTYYPDSRVTVVLLANLHPPETSPAVPPANVVINRWLGTLAHGEAVILPSERKATSPDATMLAGYVGVYGALAPGRTPTPSEIRVEFTVTLEAGRLYLTGPRLPKSQMQAEAKDRFFLRDRDVQIEFTRDETGRVVALGLGRIRAARK